MDNLSMYEKYAQPPKDALKDFNNGSFSGTDINPMWRIKVLTEEYGECGFGWYVEPVRRWAEKTRKAVRVNGEELIVTEVSVFYEVALYVKRDGEWSKPIYGVGGNTLAEYFQKRGSVIVSDEAYKMAYTDAISIACKALGIGANVWWQSNDTKYTKPKLAEETSKTGTTVENSTENAPICADCRCVIAPYGKRTAQQMAKAAKDKFGRVLCVNCASEEAARTEAAGS